MGTLLAPIPAHSAGPTFWIGVGTGSVAEVVPAGPLGGTVGGVAFPRGSLLGILEPLPVVEVPWEPPDGTSGGLLGVGLLGSLSTPRALR